MARLVGRLLPWLALCGCLLAACGGSSSGSSDSNPQLDGGIEEGLGLSSAEASDDLAIDAHDEPLNGDAIGRACQSDAECSGFHCVRSTDDFGLRGSGGPPNGYCTFDCTAETQMVGKVNDVCAQFNSYCINFGAPGVKAPAWCLRRCQLGKTTKCLGRPDVVCALNGVNNPRSLCLPMCAVDTDCPGRKCDEGTGMCLDREPAHAPLYASCLAGRTISVCSAYCLTRDDLPAGQTAPGECVKPCSIDSPTACGRSLGTPVSSGLVGFCFGQPDDGVGDLGQCIQFCDTAADCVDKDPGTTCEMYLDGALGHGLCVPPGVGPMDAGATDAVAVDATPGPDAAASPSDAASSTPD